MWSTALLRPLVALVWRLTPFPFAGLPVVVSETPLNHFVPPLIARYDEGRQVAAAEAKRAERYYNEDLQQQFTHDRLALARL